MPRPAGHFDGQPPAPARRSEPTPRPARPDRCPSSTSASFTRFRSVSGLTPSCCATRVTPGPGLTGLLPHRPDHAERPAPGTRRGTGLSRFRFGASIRPGCRPLFARTATRTAGSQCIAFPNMGALRQQAWRAASDPGGGHGLPGHCRPAETDREEQPRAHPLRPRLPRRRPSAQTARQPPPTRGVRQRRAVLRPRRPAPLRCRSGARTARAGSSSRGTSMGVPHTHRSS